MGIFSIPQHRDCEMNILLVGEYYSNNLGDPLLCETVRRCIEEAFSNAVIVPFDISGRVGFDQFYRMSKRTRKQKYFSRIAHRFGHLLKKTSAVFRVYADSADRWMRVWYMITDILKQKQIDMVVFAGGEMFMDYFTGPIYVLLNSIKRIPVVFHACGVYSLSKDSCRLLRPLLKRKNVRSISLRDSYDYFCSKMGFSKKVSKTFDTALLCSRYYSQYKSPQCIGDYGVGMIDLPQYKECQITLVGQLLSSDYKWRLITNGSESDYIAAKKILLANGVEEKDISTYLYPQPHSICDFIKEITSFAHIISFRMHSQICAVSFEIPAFGLVWDKKIVELFEGLGTPECCCNPIDGIDLKNIIDELSYAQNTKQNQAINLGSNSNAMLIQEISDCIKMGHIS